MIIRKLGSSAVYIAQGSFLEGFLEEDFEKTVNLVVSRFLRRRLFREAVYAHKNSSEMDGFAVLSAHGQNFSRRKNDGVGWVYTDRVNGKSKAYPIQDWVDELDGKKHTLILACCNPFNRDLRSEESILVHVAEKVSFFSLLGKRNKIRMYVPEVGYVEDDYRRLRSVI